MNKVLVTSRSFGKLSKEPLEMLLQAGIQVDCLKEGEDFAQKLPGYDGLIIGAKNFDPFLFDACPRLRIIVKPGVGVDNIPIAQAKEHGVTVANTPGANSEAVADLTFGLMLLVSRCMLQSVTRVKAGDRKQDVGSDVHGKTLGLIGFGRIAQKVARRAAGFDMNVLAYDPYVKPPLAKQFEHVTLCSLDEIYRFSDYISIHASLSSETEKLIGDAAFAKMKEGVYLINTSRGGIVDEEALCRAVDSGKVAGAGLDVTCNEPTPPEDELLKRPQIIVTNHIGQYSKEALNTVGCMAARAMIDFFEGRQPQNKL